MALAQIKSQTPHSLFKSIRFNWRWRKWAIWNIHELGTTQVWPLSEWLYNFLGYMLHNRYSQAPRAPIKPNFVSPKPPPQRTLSLHSAPASFLPNPGSKEIMAWSLRCTIAFLQGSTRALVTLLNICSNSCVVFVVFNLPLEQCPE